ncbi:ATP-binding protein [Roseateles sp.]|uniref:hybrid sensor histidine kinase/response regulator n=1 Tax=Roseateles sp. TaxID=1971397 RepID=UPI0039EAD262
MRLRPALMACMVAALAVVALRLTSIAIARQAAAGNDAQSQMVDVISRDATNLLVLTQDYGLRHGERAAREWGQVHQRLSQALSDYADDDGSPQVAELQATARALPQLFAALREATVQDDISAHARREALTAQLFDATRRVSDGAFDLSRNLAERRRTDAQRQRWLTVATQLSLLAVTLMLAGLLLRRVLRPIDRLRNVAEAVEGGDLTARSGLRRRDELGQLSQALDAMTAALQQRDAALRESNRQLARNKAFLERAGRMTGVSAWELELDSRQLTWTTQTHAIHRLGPGPELDAEGLLRSFTPESEQRLRDAMGGARRSGQGWDLELELPAIHGQPRWLHSIGAAERDPGGRVVRLMGAMQDITERRAVADTLRRATEAADAASAAKSEFLANMGHEIRTPMNAVMGLSFLLERTPLNAEQQDLLAKINGASRSLLDVINAVLDLSKIEAGEMALETAPFDPSALLQEVAGLFQPQAQAKGVTLGLALDTDLPALLLGDAARLRQIIGNLLSNAVKFTAVGGIRLTARCPRPDARPLPLEITVEDSGIGIPADALSRLFTPFTQADSSMSRRYGGTGLGLSIVRQLCGLMGGRVDVSSTPGTGSRFVVRLAFEPVSEAPRPAPPPKPQQDWAHEATAVQRLPGVRVLVADDSVINLEVAQRILEDEGAAITLAHDGAAAVARLRAQPAGFDAVLLDVQMPVLDGLAAARCIRAELGLRELPLIALTAGALLSERQRALDAGMNDFVSKPFDPDGLVLLLRQQVERTQPHRLPTTTRVDDARSDPLWPALAGIDREEARQHLQGDADFFARLLARLLDEFADLATPPASSDAAWVASRLHKLGGSAALLGAAALSAVAGRGEAQARAGADFSAELAEVGRLLAALEAEARPWLQQREPVRQPEVPGAAGLPDAQALAGLRAALQAQDLAALARFAALAPALRSACGETAFEQLQHALQRLDFDAALALLSPAGAAPA